MHPACLSIEELVRQCDFRRQRRSGPGGQHRNKVETGVFVRHRPTGIEGAATERRSQADNRAAAIERLRVKLAIEVRDPVPDELRAVEATREMPSPRWKSRMRGERLVIGRRHEDFAALLSEALDVLRHYEFDFRPAARRLSCSRSQMTKLIGLEPAAMAWVNRHRRLRGLHEISGR